MAGGLSTAGRRAAAAPPQEAPGISPEALAQIESLIAEKESRTGAERKIDSQLIYELKMQRGEWIADRVRAVETDVEYNDDGKVVVDIKADVSAGLLGQLRAGGAEILDTVAEGQSIRASVPLDNVEAIAGLPGVRFVQPKQEAVTSAAAEQAVAADVNVPAASPTAAQRTQPNFSARAATVRAALSAALRRDDAVGNVAGSAISATGVGSANSQGVLTHGVVSARGTFNTDGTGIKIGVLSNGVTSLAQSQALGDLGPVTVLPGQAGTGDEGTAMLEIVHDMAPGAQLFYATALGSITGFAQNIRDLRAAGCDIIVDDVFYFVETPFQDGQAPGVISNTNGGVVIQAVNDVTADGAMYFSSAGNSGNFNDGTAGVWEGDFVDGGPTGAPLAAGNRLHQFAPGQNFNSLTVLNTAAPVSLYWSDPLGGSSNDYDMFRLNPAGTAVIGSSTNIQSGTQDPYEQVNQAATSPRIVIVKKASAQPRFLHLNGNRARFQFVTGGTTHGHSHALEAYSTAAVPAFSPFGAPPNPTGPFPALFSPASQTELFTSDGPRRIFYTANGTPYTPGNFSGTGGVVRQKPDITAADGVSVTGVGGFSNPFYGTSAAAPHAAAIAGLIKAADPSLTNAQIRAALLSTAIDIETPGTDRDTGAGIVMPYAAMQALNLPGTAFLEFGAITASENPGDGNGLIDAGEGASLVVQLKNTGVVNATNVTATLASSTPGVTVTLPNSSPYADLAAGGGAGTNLQPFLFTVGGGVSCPATLQFTLTVNYAGGGPQVLNFTVPTGPPPVNISSVLDVTTAPSGAGYAGTSGTIATRHFRDGIASACGPPKPAFPGTTAPGTRAYDAYTFQTCPSSGPTCITVTLAGANAINLFSAAYTGNFNPANLAQNYVADAGSSAATRTYSFNLPAGAQTFTILVYDVPLLAAPSNTAYTLNVSGGCIGSCSVANQVPVAKAKNVTVAAGADCTAFASVDDGSFDPDGDAITVTQSPAGPYPLGTTNVLLTVTDPRGATSQAWGSVTVVDATPPAVSAATATPNSMWPPNHQMFDVAVGYTASDNCGPVTSVLTVSSNEPVNGTGDGDTAPDWQVIDAHHVRLRSERSGKGSGRVYTITVTTTDGAGNQTVRTTTVNIP
ncbi:MAG: S8 family serine peptidase, partial [Pyrinomonadaceae bacterium]